MRSTRLLFGLISLGLLAGAAVLAAEVPPDHWASLNLDFSDKSEPVGQAQPGSPAGSKPPVDWNQFEVVDEKAQPGSPAGSKPPNTSPALRQEYSFATVHLGGKTNSYVIRPDNTIKRLDEFFATNTPPVGIDERTFYLHVAINFFAKYGYDVAAMTSESVIIRTPFAATLPAGARQGLASAPGKRVDRFGGIQLEEPQTREGLGSTPGTHAPWEESQGDVATRQKGRASAFRTLPGMAEKHWIESVLDDGNLIKLEDGSLWRVSPLDVIDSALWLPTSDITIIDGDDPEYPHKLVNTDDNEVVNASPIESGRPHGAAEAKLVTTARGTSNVAARDVDIDLYDSAGKAVAYIAADQEITFYLWSGKPCAYLDGQDVYGFNGKHLGWFQSGVIYDHDGHVVAALAKNFRTPVEMAPLKTMKELRPLKSLKELRPLKPLFLRDWSQLPAKVFFLNGTD
jgi:hypothetical protein